MELDWIAVAFIGAAIGFGEIVSRYRDAPFRATLTLPGFLYVVLNAGISIVALFLTRAFEWNLGVDSGANALQTRWIQVIASGFGAMAVLRTSLFNIRVGGQDVGLGPSSFLQIILGAADREVDRLRAESRAKSVSRIMKDISFEKAHTALTVYCLALMQNLTADEQAQLAREIAELAGAQIDPRSKSLTLGLALMNIVGEDVLRVAINNLGDDIKADADHQPSIGG